MHAVEAIQRNARRLINRLIPRAIILLYHRVAELPRDPQLLCVTPQHFAEHLQVIRARGAAKLTALGGRLGGGGRGKCPIIVTFDDGYADNLYNAKPLLEKWDVPATVFVAAGYVGRQREFWYDDLERILFDAPKLPSILRVTIAGTSNEWHLGPGVNRPDGFDNYRQWNVTSKQDPTVRHSLYRALFEKLHPLADEQRNEALEHLCGWAGVERIQRPTHRTLAAQELIRLADGRLVEIGSHTVSHPVLSALPVNLQAEEISLSKSMLEGLLGDPIRTFAYPFGGHSHYTAETVAAVRAAGFQWACSNFAGLVRADTDPWQLPRFLVRDCDGDQLACALEQWTDA